MPKMSGDSAVLLTDRPAKRLTSQFRLVYRVTTPWLHECSNAMLGAKRPTDRARMNKTHLQTVIIDKLQADLAVAKDALKASHEAATHAESKAENKYDTRGLEAAYLADGQRKRVHEIETAISNYQNLPVRSHRNEAITLGALVSLESADSCRWVFLGPDAAGLSVTVEGEEVLVISPRSPLGKALLGCEEGDEAEIKVEGQSLRYSLISVS